MVEDWNCEEVHPSSGPTRVLGSEVVDPSEVLIEPRLVVVVVVPSSPRQGQVVVALVSLVASATPANGEVVCVTFMDVVTVAVPRRRGVVVARAEPCGCVVEEAVEDAVASAVVLDTVVVVMQLTWGLPSHRGLFPPVHWW
jgi:hypothetical protein